MAAINKSRATYEDRDETEALQSPEMLTQMLNTGVKSEMMNWKLEDDLNFTEVGDFDDTKKGSCHTVKRQLLRFGGYKLALKLNGSKYLNSFLGKVVSFVVAMVAAFYTVNKCLRLNTVSLVIDYEISNRLPVEEVYRDYVKAEMIPYNYSRLPEDANSFSIWNSQFKDCKEFLSSHEQRGINKEQVAQLRLVDWDTYLGAANNFDKNITIECDTRDGYLSFRVPNRLLQFYLATLHPKLVNGEEKLPSQVVHLNKTVIKAILKRGLYMLMYVNVSNIESTS